MNLEEKRKRLAEIELLLESCTYDEYRELAKEYSILSDQIDADLNLHSENIKVKEKRRAFVNIVSTGLGSTTHPLNQ